MNVQDRRGSCPLGAYILVLLKFIGFTGISLLASKYYLLSARHAEYYNKVNKHSPYSHKVCNLVEKADLIKSLHVTVSNTL